MHLIMKTIYSSYFYDLRAKSLAICPSTRIALRKKTLVTSNAKTHSAVFAPIRVWLFIRCSFALGCGVTQSIRRKQMCELEPKNCRNVEKTPRVDISPPYRNIARLYPLAANIQYANKSGKYSQSAPVMIFCNA